jgi:hypothetical protein
MASMNEAKVSHYLPELVGKTIKRICYLEPENQGNGSPQILFEFSDGSNFKSSPGAVEEKSKSEKKETGPTVR